MFAAAGEGSLELAQFPHDVVAKVDRIVVAREIADGRSEAYGRMQQFKVAAIVPFYPNARTSASWMLLPVTMSSVRSNLVVGAPPAMPKPCTQIW